MHNCAYNLTLGYQWNRSKAAANRQKHGIRFADATSVLEDEYAITIHDEELIEEDRYVTLGMNALGQILVVVYTHRDDDIRIISARRATAPERAQYEENL